MFPEGMTSGYYKYIAFEPIEKSTGKVYDLPCHSIMQKEGLFPNTEWVAKTTGVSLSIIKGILKFKLG